MAQNLLVLAGMRKSLILLFLLMAWRAVGAPAFGPAIPLTPPPNIVGHQMPALALTAGGATVIWHDDATRAGRAAAGQSIASDAVLTPDATPYRDASAASMGDESYVTWVENDWIYGFVVGTNGKARTEPRLLAMVDSRHTQRIAAGASSNRYLFVWGIWSKILAIVLDKDGNVLVGDTPLIPGGGITRAVDKVAVASDGTDFLVVWDESSDLPWDAPCGITCPSGDRTVHAIKVTADGQPRPETEIELAAGAGMPDVVWNGTDYLVVWASMPNGGIAGRHIGRDGAPAGPVVPFAGTAAGDFGPHLVWDGAAYGLGFVRLQGEELRAIRSNGDGSLIAPLFDGPIAHGSAPRTFSMAASGKTIAIAYEEGGRIQIRRVNMEAVPGRVRAARPH